MMEFPPKQNYNEAQDSLENKEMDIVVPENINMRIEVYEIAKELDASKERYQEELKNLARGDKGTKENAKKYLETMQADLAERADSFDVNLDKVTPEEVEVRNNITVRLGELLEALENANE